MSIKRIIIEAIFIIVVCTTLSISINAFRKEGIPLIRTQPYEIFVPCKEAIGQTTPLEYSQFRMDSKTLLIDARSAEVYQTRHLDKALSVPYDFLDPVSPPMIKKLLSYRVNRVVIYGDGQNPDSGKELAKEIAGKGLRNVFYIKGGAPFIFKAWP